MGSGAFHISEVVFGPEGYAVLTNGSTETADPEGLLLCQFPAYPNVPAGPVSAGSTVQVSGSDLGGLDYFAGELALYVRPAYSDPDAIVGYLQWGSTGHKREEPAIEAGVWQELSFVDAINAVRINASGQDANSSRDWMAS